MRKLLGILLCAALLVGGFAFGQPEEVVTTPSPIEGELVLPIEWAGMAWLDPSPHGGAMFRVRNKDVAPYTDFNIVRKGWGLPLDMNIGLAGALGTLIGTDNDGEKVSLAPAIEGGVMISGIEQVLVKGISYFPWIGDKLAKYLDYFDGEAGYGFSFEVEGLAHIADDPSAAFHQYFDHGVKVGGRIQIRY